MADRICSVPDCDRAYRSKGFCNPHYLRFRKYGNPLGGEPLRQRAAGLTCAIEECQRPVRNLGICRVHYDRHRLTGRYDLRTDAERFQDYTAIGATPCDAWRPVPGPCINWVGAVAGSGYGNFYVQRSYTTAHRYAYEMAHGPVSDDLHVDHLCRNRTCVNPDHLEPVTPAENLRRAAPFRNRVA